MNNVDPTLNITPTPAERAARLDIWGPKYTPAEEQARLRDERPAGSTGYPDYEATDPACPGAETKSVAMGQTEKAVLHIQTQDTTDELGVGNDRAEIIYKDGTEPELKDPRDERIRELVVALNQAQTNFLKEYWARRTAEGKAVEAEMARAARDSVIAELNGIIDRSLGKEISALRVAQDLAYGGPKHDDTHTPVEWRVFIQIYNNLGEEYASEPEIRESKLLAVAGLAVAAIQSSRRKRNA